MKLSEVKGERVFDVIADILPPLYNIADDKETTDLFIRKPMPKGMTAEEYGSKWLVQASNRLLKKHKKDCIAILSTIEGVSAKQYAENLTLTKLINDVADLIADPDLNALFFSRAQSSDNSSGSV